MCSDVIVDRVVSILFIPTEWRKLTNLPMVSPPRLIFVPITIMADTSNNDCFSMFSIVFDACQTVALYIDEKATTLFRPPYTLSHQLGNSIE